MIFEAKCICHMVAALHCENSWSTMLPMDFNWNDNRTLLNDYTVFLIITNVHHTYKSGMHLHLGPDCLVWGRCYINYSRWTIMFHCCPLWLFRGRIWVAISLLMTHDTKNATKIKISCCEHNYDWFETEKVWGLIISFGCTYRLNMLIINHSSLFETDRFDS